MVSVPPTNAEVHGVTLQRATKAPADQYVSGTSAKTAFIVPFGSDPYFATENIWSSKNKIDILYEQLLTMAEV